MFFEELNYEVIEENIGYGVNTVFHTLKGRPDPLGTQSMQKQFSLPQATYDSDWMSDSLTVTHSSPTVIMKIQRYANSYAMSIELNFVSIWYHCFKTLLGRKISWKPKDFNTLAADIYTISSKTICDYSVVFRMITSGKLWSFYSPLPINFYLSRLLLMFIV